MAFAYTVKDVVGADGTEGAFAGRVKAYAVQIDYTDRNQPFVIGHTLPLKIYYHIFGIFARERIASQII
jgi:hypothetical protein